ncbi:MAG: hypothetical protein M1837_006664 [Sclerophora amabilis]|nr:MAG: hypothetical protein M1837_006664 [Sclerophora amabilis]
MDLSTATRMLEEMTALYLLNRATVILLCWEARKSPNEVPPVEHFLRQSDRDVAVAITIVYGIPPGKRRQRISESEINHYVSMDRLSKQGKFRPSLPSKEVIACWMLDTLYWRNQAFLMNAAVDKAEEEVGRTTGKAYDDMLRTPWEERGQLPVLAARGENHYDLSHAQMKLVSFESWNTERLRPSRQAVNAFNTLNERFESYKKKLNLLQDLEQVLRRLLAYEKVTRPGGVRSHHKTYT